MQAMFSSSFSSLFEGFNEQIPPFVTFMRPVGLAYQGPFAVVGHG